jgi:protein SCO1/2
MLTGRPAVFSFVFAHCTSVCPALARTLRDATDTLGPGRTQLALITLDPWRDTPAALPEVARRWSLPTGTHLLSGPPDDVCRALDELDVARERDLRSGDVSHVPLVLVVDRRGRIAYRFVNPPASWIVEAVRRVEADS